MAERVCKKCEETKDLETEFYKNRLSKGGRLTSCIACVKIAQATYQKTPEGKATQRRSHQKFGQTEHGKKALRLIASRWRKTASGKAYRASRRVEIPDLDGVKTCSKCTDSKPRKEFFKDPGGLFGIQAHCKKCHMAGQKLRRKTPAGKAYRANEYLTRDYTKEMANVHNYQARKAKAPGRGVSHPEWIARIVACGNRCVYCGNADCMLTRDHVEPLFKKGAHEPENLVSACKSCNSAKGPRFILEWVWSDPTRFVA